MPKINRIDLGEIRWAFPPVEIQDDIVMHLNSEIQPIDGIIEKVEISIEKLREYRISLISAAVTGKIDVREEVA